MDANARTAGVDVGGTKVAVGLLDGTTLTPKGLEPTALDDPEALLSQITRLVQDLGDVEAVGVGVPSVVRLSDGRVVSSVNIESFRDVALRDELADRLGVPVRVDNDANLAALSEAWDDELQLRHRSLVAITVGTGIGGGAVVDGRPLHGSRTSAFELGHLTVAADLTDGAPAAGEAPLPSSLEHWASGRALDRLARDRGFDDGPALADAAEEGDAKAIDALRILGERLGVGIAEDPQGVDRFRVTLLGERLGVGIAAVVTLLEPEAVVIGGGVSRAGELLVGPARDAAHRLLLPGLGTETEIRVASLGPQAGLRGAALLARLEEHPS